MGNWLLVPALQLEQRVNADPSTSSGLKLFLVQKYIAGVLFVLRYELFFLHSHLFFFVLFIFPMSSLSTLYTSFFFYRNSL